MSGRVSDLSELAADLAYAAGPGAARIATSVPAAGNVQARTGFTGPEMPGPALQTVLARRTGHAARQAGGVDPSVIPAVADRMGADALGQGADLLARPHGGAR